jgi:anti-sigma regulatory factor (Ser/Thr protein kinase)
MTRDDIRLEIASDARLLCALRALVRTYVGLQGFPFERADEVVLAVDEACTNAIRHSYGGSTDRSIELTLRSLDDGIEIVLRDEGTPASRERLAQRELTPPEPGTVVPGGLGVQIMYRVFDEVTFEPGEDAGNRVTMRLKRPPVRDAV